MPTYGITSGGIAAVLCQIGGLESLLEDSKRKPIVVNRIDVSWSTVGRAIKELTPLTLIRKGGEEWQMKTRTGEQQIERTEP